MQTATFSWGSVRHVEYRTL